MTITNIISAIGNNNSIYPLLLRDCGIEVPTKVALTYKQNESDKDIAMLATRERLVDEYTVSAVWLGGIPLLEKIGAKVFKKNGFNPEISSKLLKEEANQGLDYNIKKFKDLAPEAVKDLEFLKNNQAKYKKLLGGKILAETAIPIALMGFVIPKLIFAWTANTKRQMAQKREAAQQADTFVPQMKSMDDFASKNISFKGGLSSLAEMSTVQKMAVTDGGYAVGRLITARNRDAAIDVGVKMAGMMFLNFVFPGMLAKFLDKSTGKMLNTNLNLDIKMLDDKEFIDAIKNNKLTVPDAKSEKELLDFVDNNPKSLFVKYADKYKKVTMLENGVRDPRKYVDLKELKAFRDSIENISKNAVNSGDVVKFMKKAKGLKAVNILANVGISSFLLAYGLPKAQFAFRKKFLGMELEPGIAE
ncbi:MAG: hypothetical protein NC390_01250 [Fusobacterium sp.]|nr:hypothetical protein [Fusobacterium sp.]